jgi:UrcA family protein
MNIATLIGTSSRPARHSALLAASAIVLGLAASPALAQDYGSYRDDPGYYRGPPETVEVIAPRYRPRTARGGEIIEVSLSKRVRTDDLDLRSSWGAYELRSRIRQTARAECEKLDRRYIIVNDDGPSCYKMAVAGAMDQADAAIADARGYAYAH